MSSSRVHSDRVAWRNVNHRHLNNRYIYCFTTPYTLYELEYQCNHLSNGPVIKPSWTLTKNVFTKRYWIQFGTLECGLRDTGTGRRGRLAWCMCGSRLLCLHINIFQNRGELSVKLRRLLVLLRKRWIQYNVGCLLNLFITLTLINDVRFTELLTFITRPRSTAITRC